MSPEMTANLKFNYMRIVTTKRLKYFTVFTRRTNQLMIREFVVITKVAEMI